MIHMVLGITALVGAFEIKEGGELSYSGTQRLQKQRYSSQKC